mgnify:FL=1
MKTTILTLHPYAIGEKITHRGQLMVVTGCTKRLVTADDPSVYGEVFLGREGSWAYSVALKAEGTR